jgi:glycosyltransferase involved in cell wall biosynthesis
MKLSIIVPVYNNASTLEALVGGLQSAVGSRVQQLEIILLNDGSRDASWVTIEKLCQTNPGVIGVNFARNFGQHAGIKAGLYYATGDQIVLMDADLEDLPEHVPLLLDAMKPDLDCVYTVTGTERIRLTSVLFHRLTGIFTRSEVAAGVGTMRLFTRKFAKALLTFPERRPVWGPIMHALGFRHATIRLPRTEKRKVSTYNFMKRLHLAMDFLIANTSIPFTLILFTSITLFASSLIYAAVILIEYSFNGSQAPSGVTLTVFLMVVLFAFNFLFLAIMGLYIHRVMIESLGRPLFVVSDVLNSEVRVLTDNEPRRELVK